MQVIPLMVFTYVNSFLLPATRARHRLSWKQVCEGSTSSNGCVAGSTRQYSLRSSSKGNQTGDSDLLPKRNCVWNLFSTINCWRSERPSTAPSGGGKYSDGVVSIHIVCLSWDSNCWKSMWRKGRTHEELTWWIGASKHVKISDY